MTLSTLIGGSGVPQEPDWSANYTDILDLTLARETWRTVVNELTDAGTLAYVNGSSIKRLVDFSVIYERAARDLAEAGALGRAKRTRVPQINPNWSIMRRAADQITTLEAELCLSPRRRNSAGKLQRKARAARPADDYLKPVAK